MYACGPSLIDIDILVFSNTGSYILKIGFKCYKLTYI